MIFVVIFFDIFFDIFLFLRELKIKRIIMKAIFLIVNIYGLILSFKFNCLIENIVTNRVVDFFIIFAKG